MNFSFYIAKRYLFSLTKASAINIITLITTFGVVIGTMALFIVLSGFSGLRTFSDSLLEVSDPDIKITPAKGKVFEVTPFITDVLSKDNEILAWSSIVEERVSLKYTNKNQIAYIKGVDANYNQIVAIDSSLSMGSWLDANYSNTAVVGAGISYKLSLGTYNFNEFLEILVPKPGTKYTLNASNLFNAVKTNVVGVYYGSEVFQNKYVFTNIALARELLHYDKNTVTGIEVKLFNQNTSISVRDAIQKELGENFVVKTKRQINELYYKVVNTENFISYLIFTLIIIIALFNVIGSIIMAIIDKRSNLKTLMNLGSTLQEVKRIFVFQGFLMVMVGLVIGLVYGVLLVFLQLHFGLFLIADNLPYPVEFRWANLFTVIVTISLLGYVAAKIASSRISYSFINK